ncbi:Protein APA1 [Vanrija pseudolonga]|uniref:Protein APA1 n=1 Tax=Vanrija pseudolonga TaxID=143232 RepID=A0AAF1BKG3_9TREE|nr:Protein APA1 [Vanrija pseudolonga]
MAQPTERASPADILARLPASFAAAKESGDLYFFPSTSRNVAGQFPFNITICPAIGAKKAAAPAEEPAHESKRVRTAETSADRPSPFRPPYVPGLYVGAFAGVDGEETTAVLLNKFAVLPEHFLLVPTEEQPQALPPTPGQLARTYSILQAAARSSPSQRLLAFYNGGPGAGASQRWRHVQFIDAKGGVPLDDWVRGVTFERQDRAVIHPTLPYIHILHPLPAAHSVPYPLSEDDLTLLADNLAPALMRSLDLAFDALRRSGGDRSQGWNLLMTLDAIHLIPRSQPAFPLGDGQTLDLNALGYAGMLLVTSEAHDAALDAAAKAEQGGLISILAKCGVPREFGEQAIEQDANQHGGAGAAWEGL